MEKSKEVLGEGHPDTLGSMNNLAFTIRALGRRQSALNLMSLCADMSQATLGKNHPDTVGAVHFRTQWEAEEIPANLTGRDDEGGGGGGGAGAHSGVVDRPGDAQRDIIEDGSTWNQPQFLWLL